MSGTTPQLEHHKVKQVLFEFYQIYNTARLSSLDHIIDSYNGKEVELLEELKKRYNAEFEPFDVLLNEYRTNSKFDAQSPPTNSILDDKQFVDPAIRSVERSVAAVTAATQQQPRPKLESRNSITLGLSNIPSLEKLMTGWKGFALEGVADARKEESNEINEAMTALFQRLLATPGLSVEVLQQLQESIEMNIRLERQLKANLRKIDFSTPKSQVTSKSRRSSVESGTVIGVNAPSSPPHYYSSSDLDGIEYGLDLMTSFDGRAHESLVLEILGLRDIVTGMRDFILQKLLTKNAASNNKKEIKERDAPDEGSTSTEPTPQIEKTSSPPMTLSEADSFGMKETCQQLNIDWLDLERLRGDLAGMTNELQLCKSSLSSLVNLMVLRDNEISELKNKIAEQQSSLTELRRSRADLIEVCEQKIRTMEGSYTEYIREMQESMQFEQEEAMSRLSSVAEQQQRWQASISNEAQTEITRLRVELAKSRRQESQREREVAYLQRQLLEASKQLAQFVVDSETADRGVAD